MQMAAAAWAAVKAASAYVVGSMKAVAAGTATAGQVATYVAVTVGGSMAMSAAAQALMKPNVGGRAPGEWVADPNAGIPFAIGPRIGVGGNIVYKNTWGKDNEYKGLVSVISGAGPITGYLGFTADKEAVTFSGDAATGRYSGQMWMRRTMGNQPDVALSDPSMPGWGANYKLSGKASFLWVLKQDSKFSVYPQGEPSPIHAVSGIKGYDHRFDDTFPGGAGPCRLGVPATYRPITNPIIADLNWCLGLKENGKVVGGLGVSPAGINWAAYTRAANIADANGWVVAALPRSDEPKSEVRAAFLQAGGAVISRQAGLISCVSRGAPKSPVMTISAADTAGPIELDTAANVLNRLNQITPRYLSEAHDWQLVAAAPVTSSVYLTEDRGRLRSDQRDYPYVPNAKQAAELAALDLANTREGIAGRWPLKAFCRDLEPGDVFTVDEPGMLLDGMDFLVLHREFEPATSTVYVTFVSETAGKVDWALGRAPNPPPTPALSARVDLSPPASGDWSVTLPTPVPGNVQVPTATITITIDNARAEGLIVEKGPSSTGPWRQIKEVAINGATLTVPLYDLAPNEVFWLALSYRAADTGLSVRDVKGPFTAGDLVAQDIIPTAPSRLALDERIDDAFGATAAVAGDLAAAELVVEATQAELVAARQESPNLLANITGIKTTVETEAMTRASEISRVEARRRDSFNMVKNSTFQNDTEYWSTGTWFRQSNDADGPYLICGESGDQYVASDAVPAQPGPVSYSFNATGGTVATFVEVMVSGTPTNMGLRVIEPSGFDYRERVENIVLPTGTTSVRFVALKPASNTSYTAIRRIKVNRGEVATDWSDDATEQQIGASVTTHSQAIDVLETKMSLAEWQVKTEAAGGKPAILRLVSSSVGSGVIIDAPTVYFGENSIFEDATDTFVTTIGAVRYIHAWGAPFGPDNLTYWVGPSHIATSSATKANAEAAMGQWRDNTGLSYFGGATLSGPFDTGLSPDTPVTIPPSGTVLAAQTTLHPMRNGAFTYRMELQALVQTSVAPAGSLSWTLMTVNEAGGDADVIATGSFLVTANTVPWQPVAQNYSVGLGHKSGRRRLQLRIGIGDANVITASIKTARLAGLYTADVTTLA